MMPIIYIHGVNVRSPDQGIALEKVFQRWVGPKLGDPMPYFPVYWGGLVADQFRWKLESRPKTPLRAAGADDWVHQLASARDAAPVLLALPKARQESDSILIGGDDGGGPADLARLSKIPVDERGDVASDLYLLALAAENPVRADPPALLALAADRVAQRWEVLVSPARRDEDNARALVVAVHQELESEDQLLAAGGLADLGARAKEALSRIVSLPADALSTLASEARPAANAFVANFLGDILTYLHARGPRDQPGPIVRLVLDALRAANAAKRKSGQKLVVMTHSMGGQLLYDAVTYYAAADPDLADLQIDHWFTAGSQCSFFAELGLFQDQPDTRTPQRLPKPNRVTRWTNFYDGNDLVGFVMQPVFDGVHDIAYNTGYGLIAAHTSYLSRPSFFRLLADRM